MSGLAAIRNGELRLECGAFVMPILQLTIEDSSVSRQSTEEIFMSSEVKKYFIPVNGELVEVREELS